MQRPAMLADVYWVKKAYGGRTRRTELSTSDAYRPHIEFPGLDESWSLGSAWSAAVFLEENYSPLHDLARVTFAADHGPFQVLASKPPFILLEGPRLVAFGVPRAFIMMTLPEHSSYEKGALPPRSNPPSGDPPESWESEWFGEFPRGFPPDQGAT